MLNVNLDGFEDNILVWIRSHGLLAEGARVLLAVSGGADSVALAAGLHRLAASGQLPIGLVIGHVNHGLRGADSDGDETFVKLLGERVGVPVVCRRVDVRGLAESKRLSIETAGRTLRLATLAAMAQDNGCTAIATGHHADDQAETMAHRLLRGTALRGLCGIRPVSTPGGMRFVRPLLAIRRAEIEAYCRKNGLTWRDDASNRSCAFTRNRIRHRLLPELEKLSPGVVERLIQLAETCRAAQERVETAADAVAPDCTTAGTVAYDRAAFIRQSPWVQAELIGRAVQRVGTGLQALTRHHYQALMAHAARPNRSKSIWPGVLAVEVEHDRITFAKPTDFQAVPPREPVALQVGKRVDFGSYSIKTAFLDASPALAEGALRDKPAMTERLDADCIAGRLIVRPLQPGDRFWPIGMGAEKKCARFMLDAKIEKKTRKEAFVLADAEKILYLAPLRLDDRAKITNKTRKILEISVERADIKI